jgi:hypothetical protein
MNGFAVWRPGISFIFSCLAAGFPFNRPKTDRMSPAVEAGQIGYRRAEKSRAVRAMFPKKRSGCAIDKILCGGLVHTGGWNGVISPGSEIGILV